MQKYLFHPKIADFSKTGGRNMTETDEINFSYPTSYLTSKVLGDIRRLILPVPTWAAVDSENFRAETVWCSFGVFFPSLTTCGTKTRRAGVLILGIVEL